MENGLSSIQLAELAFAVISKEKTFGQIVFEYNIPEYLLTESIVRVVQGAHQLVDKNPVTNIDSDCLCFIHIEKTAGTSVTAFLDDSYDVSEICPALLHDDLVDVSMRRNLRHFRLLHGHFYLSCLKFAGLTFENQKLL